MTAFDEALEMSEIRLAVARKFPDILALGRWVYPIVGILGVVVLGGFLFTADPATSDDTVPPPHLAAQRAPSRPVSEPLAARGDTAPIPHPRRVQESTRTSTSDLLKPVLGALLGFAGVLIGMWLGVRHARALTRVEESGYDDEGAGFMAHNGCAPASGPTCERMYDESRLVPAYLRRAAFPATKSDLLRLAEVYPDEGLALHRLEQVTDRRYTSLHDLITEIHVD